MPDWWEISYPKGAAVGPAELPRGPLYAPGNPGSKPPSKDGPDVVACKRGISRLGRWPWQAFDDTYSSGFARGTSGNVRNTGVLGFQRQEGIEASGNMGDKTYQALRRARVPEGLPNAGEPAFDQAAVDLLKRAIELSVCPELGPVWAGGLSVLDQDCTHATSGIEHYPAFDDAFRAGRAIIAPEPITVFQQSSSNPGDAFYAEGESGIRYWFGHLVRAPATGRRFQVGEVIGEVLNHSIGGGPHVHVGVNVEQLWGKRMELSHNKNYSHGAAEIGLQLEAGKPL